MEEEKNNSRPLKPKKKIHQNWFIRKEGVVQGPFPKGMIQSFVLSGRLKLSSEVSPDKDEWTKLNAHRYLIPKVLLNVKTEEDKQRLRMAIRREDERCRDRRDSNTGDGGKHSRESKDRRKDEGVRVVDHRRVREDIKVARQRKKGNIVPAIILVLLLVGLGWGGYYGYNNSSKQLISITNCEAPAANGVNWANCKLEGYRAVSKDVKRGTFSSANLNGADFHGSNFSYSNFRYANLALVNFSYTDLSHSSLEGARLRSANLTNSDLSNANLSHANLRDARLGGANLTNTRFDNAVWIDGSRCKSGSIGRCIR